jgi:hypothetical protein
MVLVVFMIIRLSKMIMHINAYLDVFL